MSWRHKSTSAGELGTALYEHLRAALEGDGPLSLSSLFAALTQRGMEADLNFAGEAMIGAMFGAAIATDRSTTSVMGREILEGMTREFNSHLREQGASAEQQVEWLVILKDRFQAFRTAMEGYDGLEPPWKLGREFLWNLTGLEEYDALLIKRATGYLMDAVDAAQRLLNDLGPRLKLDPTLPGT